MEFGKARMEALQVGIGQAGRLQFTARNIRYIVPGLQLDLLGNFQLSSRFRRIKPLGSELFEPLAGWPSEPGIFAIATREEVGGLVEEVFGIPAHKEAAPAAFLDGLHTGTPLRYRAPVHGLEVDVKAHLAEEDGTPLPGRARRRTVPAHQHAHR